MLKESKIKVGNPLDPETMIVSSGGEQVKKRQKLQEIM
jgi:hypothetical protein